MKAKQKISAIIACYKEERAIPIMYQRLTRVFKTIQTDYEIIFVNDGSPDNSELVIKNIVEKDAHVIGINHARSFNSQMGFTSGMDIASGDAVVLLDGDLQDPPEMIEKFFKKWNEGYDVVYGIRAKREASLYMSIFYKLFYRVFNKMSYIPIPLDAGDFSLIDRKVVDVLRQFPERDRFLRGLRAWVGFKQTGIPFVRPERMFGKTTNSFFKNIDWALLAIFSVSYVPLRLITVISFSMFLFALVAILSEIAIRLIFNRAPEGVATILVVVLFLGSVQLFCLSILGQYIGRIFEEVKARPKYVVKSIFRNTKNHK